jgi:hypothetical protein
MDLHSLPARPPHQQVPGWTVTTPTPGTLTWTTPGHRTHTTTPAETGNELCPRASGAQPPVGGARAGQPDPIANHELDQWFETHFGDDELWPTS